MVHRRTASYCVAQCLQHNPQKTTNGQVIKEATCIFLWGWVECNGIKPETQVLPAFPIPSGYPLCRTAWLRFLGVGKQRMLRTKRKFRGLDDRTINQGTSISIRIILNQYVLCEWVSIRITKKKSKHSIHFCWIPLPISKEQQLALQRKLHLVWLSFNTCTGLQLNQWPPGYLLPVEYHIYIILYIILYIYIYIYILYNII